MEASNPSPPSVGSIIDTTQRLRLWAGRSGSGMTRVEFSSEFARQRVMQALKTALLERSIPLHEVTLPTYQDPVALVDYLLKTLNQLESGVVSITGFATAFSTQTPLPDALRIVNFNRERLVHLPLRQIWWMTPVFLQTAIHAMPDLNRWFMLQLQLTEAMVNSSPSPLVAQATGSTANIDDAYQRSHHLIREFEQARTAGATTQELLTTYLLPALEALADVAAQQQLHDLTTQFEGLLGQLKYGDSPALATSLGRLAELYREQGRFGQAEPLFLRALAIQEQQLGADHPAVATTLNNLALLYKSQGRYGQAEPLYLRALAIGEQQLGADHPEVATTLNNLANLYKNQGRYAEAEPLYLRALAISEQQLGADHPEVATTLNNLANLYKNQGRYAEAEPLYLRALAIGEQQLGAYHPAVATRLNNLALLYEAQGRYAEAEPLYLRALAIGEQQLGADHPLVATYLNNLANLYEAQGRYAEAEPLYLRALAIGEQQLGADHPAVATRLNNLAYLYRAQGRDTEAEPLYIRTIDIDERCYGCDHPEVAIDLINLAYLYRAQERYAEAEPLYLRALAIRTEKLGDDHPKTQTLRQNFRGFLQSVMEAGKTGQLSDHPATQDLLRQMREGREE